MGRDDRAVILRHVAFNASLRSLRNDPKQTCGWAGVGNDPVNRQGHTSRHRVMIGSSSQLYGRHIGERTKVMVHFPMEVRLPTWLWEELIWPKNRLCR